MNYRFLAVVLAAISVDAVSLEGRVVDSEGIPIVNAVVEIVGSRKSVSVDDAGYFTLDEQGVQELHVKAPGFSHKVILLEPGVAGQLDVELMRSAIEQVDVFGVPIHTSTIESVQPVSVLTGEDLRDHQASTLGDTLAHEMGVHTSFHGNVASTPIIRGLSGPRVLISQNSLDVSDVSRVGPDHAVASEVSTAEQVEVLRGPATLFYGSGAIGGVVNVVDKRVPQESDTFGEVSLSHDTVSRQNQSSFFLNTGAESFAVHLDGFWRKSEDYRVPVIPEGAHDDDHADVNEDPSGSHTHDLHVPNSADQSTGYTIGSSYLLDNGYIGISAGHLDREYGIPGHSHGGEHDEHASGVFADLKQDRYQLISELDIDNPWLSTLNTRIGYTDYTHAEIEQGSVGTAFYNETLELKLDLNHQPVSDLNGGIVVHFKSTEEKSEGEEAFAPPSKTDMLALALVEEFHYDDFLFQMGARVEHVTLKADYVMQPEIDVHSHDSPAHDSDTDHHHESEVTAPDLDFTPMSFSAGVVWDFQPGFNVALSLSHSERAPSAAELFSFGPHVGTGSYEVGALFNLHRDDDGVDFEFAEGSPKQEESNNIDLTFRKHEGDLGIILNAFYNQVENYYYESVTGLYAESSHDHGHEEGAEDDDIHSDELPVFLFSSADAVLHGFEGQAIWQVSPVLKTTVFSDYVNAELDDSGEYLPRIPPFRYGARLDYQKNNWSAYFSWTRFDDQEKTAPLEDATKGYEWMDASVTWRIPSKFSDLAVFLKVENIADAEARVHTSFLKEIAPRPAINYRFGLRAAF